MDIGIIGNSKGLDSFILKEELDDAYLALMHEDSKETLRRNRQQYHKFFMPFDPEWALHLPVKMLLPSGVTDLAINVDTEFDWSNYPSVLLEQMWFFSLHYIGRLLATGKKYSDRYALDQAQSLISSFVNFCGKQQNVTIIAGIGSADHSTAMRIKVLIAFYQLSLSGDIHTTDEFRKKLLHEIHRWAEWLSDSKNYSPNNHGLMASMSLLYVSLLFDKNGGAKYYYIASKRILDLANDAFDSSGLNNENTIGYHNYNLNLYKKIISWCTLHKIDSSFVKQLELVVFRATNALAHCIFPNGCVPPIGDSPVYKIEITPSINKSHMFQESGFAVIKNDDFYLSVICGSRTEFHKQMDDSSICVQYKGVDLITDAGSYTYDRGNRFRQYMASSAGHSGIFSKRLDGLRRRAALNRFGPFPGIISKFEEVEDGVRLACSYSIAGASITLFRYIYVIWDSEIVIVDKVEGDSSDAVQRFLFGSTVNVSDESNYLQLDAPNLSCTLFHNATETDRYTAQDNEKHVRGWCSVKFKELLPTTGVDLTNPKDRFFSTIISLKGEKQLASCSQISRDFANMVGSFFQQH